jgi:flagellar motor protein MotB
LKGCAAPLKATPFRVSITDHTSAIRLPAQPGYGPWELSADRANAIRKQLEADRRAHVTFLHGGRKGRHPAVVPR